MEKVDFGDLQSAREIRSRDRVREYLDEDDDGRQKTVVLDEETPDRVREIVQGEAADSRRYKAFEYGQRELTAGEKSRIDFSQTDVFTARTAKAIAEAKGVDDWVAFFDQDLTAHEQREVFESAQQSSRGGGQRGGREFDDEREQDRRAARGYNMQKSRELDRAKSSAFRGDSDAQSFVREEAEFGEVFDLRISESDSGFVGSGEDFDRVQDVHEERSSRAQTLDEKRSATTTRDPFTWTNNKSKYDFPGVDTVEPQRLHSQRSERAQRIDEREIAPAADTKEQWAMHPDRYDWPGVDRPATYGPTMDTPIPQAELDRGGQMSESFEALQAEDEYVVESSGFKPPSDPRDAGYRRADTPAEGVGDVQDVPVVDTQMFGDTGALEDLERERDRAERELKQAFKPNNGQN